MTNTILLADDSVTIQKVIELTFMDEDYEVVSVGNGDEALDRLEEVAPDVVIADVHMPGASGYDVARRAKQLHPQAPVLLLVGTFEPFDEADFQSSGADAFLKKPFDSQELLQRVSELMAARAGFAAEEPAPERESSREAEPPPDPPSAAPEPAVPEPGAAAAAEAFAAPAAAPPPGDATRMVPAWDAESERPWRPAEPAGEEAEPLGTRRMPVFREDEPAAEESAAEAADAWSGWSLTDEPEEVEAPVAPAEAGEPAWAGEESFEPAWESAATAREEAGIAEPEWSPEEHEAALDEPAAAAAPEPAPAGFAEPAAAEAAPPPPAVAAAPAARAHHGDPFPELVRPQPAAPPPEAPAAAAPSGGGNGATLALSDSDVDRVARRVAELLGDRVIREVAWEVVPDLAEVVIKDRLRELESQVD